MLGSIGGGACALDEGGALLFGAAGALGCDDGADVLGFVARLFSGGGGFAAGVDGTQSEGLASKLFKVG